jgi:hypothetical protein
MIKEPLHSMVTKPHKLFYKRNFPYYKIKNYTSFFFSAVMNVEIKQEVNGFIHSRRVRTRRSEHSKGILEQFKTSNKSNTQSWGNSSRSMRNGPVFDDTMLFNDISTQNETDSTTVEGFMDSLIQPEREDTVHFENIGSIPFENSRTQPEREDRTQNQSKAENDTWLLTRNTLSLYQFPNYTSERPVVQTQHSTAGKDIVENTSSENITRNLNPRFLHNILQTDVKRNGNNLSSVRTIASALPSQSSENNITSGSLYDMLALSAKPLLTSNHEAGVFQDPVLKGSNNNGSTIPSNTTMPTLFSYFTISITNSGTPFPDLNGNLTADLKHIGQVVNNTMHTVPSNKSEYYSALHTGKLSDGEPSYTSVPGKLHTAPGVSPNLPSFKSSTVSELKNKFSTPENVTSFHLSDANISIQSFPRNLPVTAKSIESENAPEYITESPTTMFVEDFPPVSTISVPTANANYNTVSLLRPLPAFKPSSSILSATIPESLVTYPASLVPSSETIASSASARAVTPVEVVTSSTISRAVDSTESVLSDPIYKSVPFLEIKTSRAISSIESSVGTVTSSTLSRTVPETITSSTISNTIQSLETMESNTVSNSELSVGTVISSTISSTAPETVTSSTISSIVPSVKTVTSSTLSSAVPSVKTVTSSTIYHYVPSVKNTISNTIYNYVPSVKTVQSTITADTVTSSTVSISVPSVENIVSNIISSTMPSAEVITSSTTSDTVPSVETLMTSTVSTDFSIVPSVSYTMETKDSRQINEVQVEISGKNLSSRRTEEVTEKSFSSLSENRNITSLNVTHEVILLTHV